MRTIAVSSHREGRADFRALNVRCVPGKMHLTSLSAPPSKRFPAGSLPASRLRPSRNEREVEVTRAKLRSLEARYDAVSQNPQDDAQIQELTLQSLRRLINQMKEEIAPFEARRRSRTAQPSSPVTKH